MLPGITRATVLQLCRDVGFELVEQVIPREWLYIADELFFSGTAAEITPIRSVDRIPIGSGKRGPMTERLQQEFTAVITCQKGRPPRLADLCQNAELGHSLSSVSSLRRAAEDTRGPVQRESVHQKQGCSLPFTLESDDPILDL